MCVKNMKILRRQLVRGPVDTVLQCVETTSVSQSPEISPHFSFTTENGIHGVKIIP